MVVGCTIAVAFGIIVDPVVNHLVFATWGGKGLTTVEDPGGTETPSRGKTVHRHQVDVVTTVVVGIIPPTAVDAFDLGLRPRQRITQPSSETAVVFPGEKLHTVGFAVAGQDETFNLDLAAEGLAITIVQYIGNLTVIAFYGEIIGLVGGDIEETGTDLVGNLRLHDVTANSIAVKGCRRALVTQGMDIL